MAQLILVPSKVEYEETFFRWRNEAVRLLTDNMLKETASCESLSL